MTSQACHRIYLALEQLEMVFVAFVERRRFAPTITLTSAAERVIGEALRNRGSRWALTGSSIRPT